MRNQLDNVRLGRLTQLCALSVCLGVLFSTGCADRSTEKPGGDQQKPGYVSRQMLGNEWPLTVDEGVVGCDGSALTFTTGGST